MKKYIILFLSVFSFANVQAQQDIGLHFMDVWQQNRTNPAHFSDNKISVGLVSVYSTTVVEGFTFDDIVRTENGQRILDIDAAIKSMQDQNSLEQYLSVETLNIGLNFGKIGVSLSHAFRFDAIYDYPKTFPQTIFQGNAQFVGETVEIGSSINFNAYNEFALGLAYQTEKFNVGARIKYLSGVAAGQTNNDRNNISLYTDPDIYQLTLNADYELQTAGFLEYNDINDVELTFSPSAEDFTLGGDNTGVAFDIGAEVDLGKLQLSASILDIGSIEYTGNAKTYSTQGTFTYDGLDISDAITGGEEVDFEAALDTIQSIFEVKETASNFTTNLAPQAYLSARYALTEKITVGALYYGRFSELNTRTVIALSGQMKLGKIATVGANYAIINDKFTNIGLNASAKIGPVQVFALTDNVIGLATQKDGEVINFRVGLGLAFGKSKE